MNSYQQSQSASWMYFMSLVFIIPFLVEPDLWSDMPWLLPVMLAFGVSVFSLFTPMRVTVNQDSIMIRFGIGVFRKKIILANVLSVATDRHSWWHGWGIRMIGLNKWVYNIKGFDIVEVATHQGAIYRIGTDTPRALEEAIRNAAHFITKNTH